MVRKWLLLCLCLEFHHKAWRCRHETDDGLKILYRKIKKGHFLEQENGQCLCSVSVKQNEKPCIDGLLSVNQALCHLLIFP